MSGCRTQLHVLRNEIPKFRRTLMNRSFITPVAGICALLSVITGCGKADRLRNGDSSAPPLPSEIWQKAPDAETRWASFENPSASKGGGGTENKGLKGHPFDSLAPGETKTLLNVDGSGQIRRMWFTLDSQDAESLRSLRLRIFWDG